MRSGGRCLSYSTGERPELDTDDWGLAAAIHDRGGVNRMPQLVKVGKGVLPADLS